MRNPDPQPGWWYKSRFLESVPSGLKFVGKADFPRGKIGARLEL
jgi:uncharacterized protein (DUF3820 family)